MKKHNLKILTITITLFVSAVSNGCTSSSTVPPRTRQSVNIPFDAYGKPPDRNHVLSSSSASAEENAQSNEVKTSKEQIKAEEIRRLEIAEQYSIYQPYGMTYDKKTDRFFYNGQLVRCFKDQISSENTNAFFFDDGIVDVEPIRNTDGTLTGLQQSSEADFKSRTKKQKEINEELKAAGIVRDNNCFELGDPACDDNSLDAYSAFGVSYDNTSDNWIYERKAIHILYDPGHYTYCDNSISDGTCLKVIRDRNGNIEKLLETEAKELEQYVQ